MSCLLEVEVSDVLKTTLLNIGDNFHFSLLLYRTDFLVIYFLNKHILESHGTEKYICTENPTNYLLSQSYMFSTYYQK